MSWYFTTAFLLEPLPDFKLQTDWDADNPDSFVSQMSSVIAARAQQVGIQPSTGYFFFDMSIYSTLQIQSSQPILELQRILSNTNHGGISRVTKW